MSNLCSVLETLHKTPDSDSESDDNIDDTDDPLNGSGNSRLSTTSNSWRGSLQKLPTTPSTSESDLANLSADSDVCRQCGQCGSSLGAGASRRWAKGPRGRVGRSRERGKGSDRESERESDKDSVGGYPSDRPPLPCRSLKDHASRSRSRRPSGGPSPSPTLHVHTCSLDTDCSSDQDKHSDSSAAGEPSFQYTLRASPNGLPLLTFLPPWLLVEALVHFQTLLNNTGTKHKVAVETDFDSAVGHCFVSDGNSACWIPFRHNTLSDGDVNVCLSYYSA